jgi:hypothetical protein
MLRAMGYPVAGIPPGGAALERSRSRRPRGQSGKGAWPSVTVALWLAADESIQVRVTVCPIWNPSIAVWRSDVFAIVLPPMLVMRPQTVTPALAAGFALTPVTQAPVVACEVVQLGVWPLTPGWVGETATPSRAAFPMWMFVPLPARISEMIDIALLIGIANPVVDAVSWPGFPEV